MTDDDSIDCLLPSNDSLANWSKLGNNGVTNNNDSYYFDIRRIETHQSNLQSCSTARKVSLVAGIYHNNNTTLFIFISILLRLG